MYQYILFDLDGTLTDPKEGICKSVQFALHQIGIEETDLDKLEPFIGPPLLDSFMYYYDMTEEEAEKAIISYRERFSVLGMYENEVYKGIPELLKQCKENCITIAVASSKPEVYVKKILEHFHLAEYFDVVVGSELDGRRTRKEEVVEEAIRRLRELKGPKLCAENTAMVGDRKFDIQGAKAFDLTSVGVEYGYAEKGELKNAGADYIAKTVSQLGKILLGNNTNKIKKSNYTKDKKQKEPDIDNKSKESEVKESKSKVKQANERQKKGKDINESRSMIQSDGTPEDSIPKNSFLRAVYVLAPFVLYFLVVQFVELLTIILLQQVTGIKDLQQMTLGNISPENLLVLIGMIAMLIGEIIVFRSYKRTDPMPVRGGKDIGICLLLGFSLAVGLNLLFGYICHYLPVSDAGYEAATFNDKIPYFMGLLFYVIISPIAEEFVFRWLVMGRIKKILGAKIAIIASALFFGCYHGNLLQGVYAFLMGLVLAIAYEWSGSFLHPVILHMAANFIIFSLAYIPDNISSAINSVWGCILSLLASLVLFVLFYRINKTEKST